MGGGEFTNAVTGKIRLGKETLSTIDGHWDDKVTIHDKRTGVSIEIKPEEDQFEMNLGFRKRTSCGR